MADLYWMTFRIADDFAADKRRQQLGEQVSAMSEGKWWTEPTSFYLFESSLSIGQVAALVKAVIDEARDIALIGMPHFKSARVVGQVNDRDLMTLMPFVKEA